MSDTPRTDQDELKQHDSNPPEPLGMVEVDFARQLERELNESNKIIRQQQLLDEENLMLKERIKRLEGAGDDMHHYYDAMSRFNWKQAKEIKL